MTFVEFIKDYGPPIAWTTTIVIAIFAHRAKIASTKRKEALSDLVALQDIVKTIINELSSYYHISERNDQTLSLPEIKIKIKFEELVFLSKDFLKKEAFKNHENLANDCDNKLEEFYDIATGEYFESREDTNANDLQIHLQQINKKALLLIQSYRQIFRAEYPS